MMPAKDRSMNPTVFQIEHGALAQLIDKLQQEFAVTNQHHEKLAIDYLDTFNWSLFKNDQTLSRISSDNQTELLLAKHSDNTIVAKLPNPGSFTFARELPEHPLKKSIRGASKRALMVQLSMKCDSRQWNILNNNEKTIARLNFLALSNQYIYNNARHRGLNNGFAGNRGSAAL